MKITKHLKQAEHHLNIALSELGDRAGRGGFWAGSWSDYRKLVKLKLRLEDITRKAEYEESKENKRP